MDSDESLVIPPLGKEHHVWHIPEDAPVSRSRRSRGNGEYESTIPISLADLRFVFPSELLADCEEASCALASFDAYAAAKLGEGSHVLGPMSAVLLRTEASSSSQIENLTVGAKNLALETIDEGTSDNAAVVVGNVRAMEAALKLGDSMTENNILAMHEALLSAQRGWGKYAGTYRTNLVWVGTDGYSPRGAAHVGPQPELIAGAMADLLEFIKRDDLSVVAQCAIARAQFETIHPFADGNGRCGRALVHAILRNKGLSRNTTPPVSAGLLHDTEDYFAALTLFREGDAAPIVRRFAQACRFAATSGRKLIDDLCEQLDEARSNLRGVRSDAAVWRVLPNLIAQPIINTRYLQRTVGLSKPQAERAIKTLSERGVVMARTGKQRSVVYEHRGILDVLDEYAAGLRRG